MYVIVTAFQTVFYIALSIFFDSRLMNSYKRVGGKDGSEPPMLDKQSDVTDHEKEVRDADSAQAELGSSDYQIKCVDLSKTYDPSKDMAVFKNTFGVKKGEVFGLLGPNGAGKTTTFKVIAMQIPATSGATTVLDHNILQYPIQTHGKFVGQCNQENLIWETLTVEESLDLVAAIKGIRGQARVRTKRLLLETLELTEFRKTISKQLSGGNKRKLCCAQSLIMSPKIEYLDEPTTGVDPVSRRALIRMIKKMKDCSVLLTTHRMDEAE